MVHSGELTKVRCVCDCRRSGGPPHTVLSRGVQSTNLRIQASDTPPIPPQAPPLGTGVMSSLKRWQKRHFILRKVTVDLLSFSNS